MIKILIFTLILVVATEQKLTTKELNQIGEACIKETGMKKSMVIYYRDTQKFPKYDKTYMEFLACSYKKQGYQSSDGEILFNNLKEFLEEFYTAEEANAAVEPCKRLKGKTHGENAFFVMVCIIENLKSIEEEQGKTS